MSNLFDNLARDLARPMPRRRAVTVLGAALITAAVPGLRPRAARADAQALGRLSVDAPCSGFGGQFCGFAVNNGYNIGCCWKKGEKFVCCNHNKEVGSWCCRAGYRCGPGTGAGGQPNCICDGDDCAEGCCKPNEECENGKCVSCTSERKCGATCCKKGETCVSKKSGLCCKDSDDICAVLGTPGSGQKAGRRRCCPKGTKCCADDKRSDCCGPKQMCRSGSCKCPPQTTACGKYGCCKPGERCSNGVCCPKGQENCGGECCDSGLCCGETCCPKGQLCAATINYGQPRVCCASDRIIITSSGKPVCCPRGTAPNDAETGCCPQGNPNCCGGDNDDELSCLGPRTICVRGVCQEAVPIGHR